ncbi:MAG: hypothetical protein ACLPKI_12220 [Streptosporangiaceae bacterium]
MTLPRSAADVLSGHVAFEVECIDRMYLNVYVPQLQYATGLVSYIHRQLGMPVASTAALAPVSAAFTKAMRAFAADRQIPWVDFAKGQRKDDVAHDYLAGFTGTEGVLFIGRAQEKVPLFRTRKRRRADGSSYPWIAAETGVVNQFYCYCVDEDFGPFFLKFCSYFPFNAKLCINGNEWAKRQAARAAIGFTPLDNAFAAVDDVPALQAICHGLGPVQIDALLRKWLARLPHPFSPADRAAGYRYDISILQAEFSLTQMLDKPVSGRIFSGQVIRDNLDLGRPDRISLIFGRSIYRGRKNHTPGTFATRVVTDGVTPSLHVLYKHTQIKQYHKQGRALRTETTINQTTDFGVGKRLTNLPAPRQIGYTANRRLLGVQRLRHDPITGADALHSACDPVIHGDGTRTAGLRFTDPRAQALLHILLIFRLHPGGFLNKDLRTLLAEYLGRPPHGPGSITPGQATYDLRRLREHGLIERIPRTHRYQVTSTGLRHAMFLTRIHDRVLRTGLAELSGPAPAALRQADRAYQAAIDDLTQRAGIPA